MARVSRKQKPVLTTTSNFSSFAGSVNSFSVHPTAQKMSSAEMLTTRTMRTMMGGDLQATRSRFGFGFFGPLLHNCTKGGVKNLSIPVIPEPLADTHSGATILARADASISSIPFVSFPNR